MIFFLFSLLTPSTLFAQKEVTLHGRVTDEDGHPIVFASIRIKETGEGGHSNEKGNFKIPVPATKYDSISLIFSYIDKVPVHKTISRNNFSRPVLIRMKQQSLTLKNVEVSAVRERRHSVSSIVFDREAIIQSHAFSLADILNKLPGKKTEAPQLHSPQTLTLRTSAQGINAINNSFGMAIYIDGVRLNKDANMQAQSLSVRGILGADIKSHGEGQGYDVPYDGFDLRDIPVENIERIEVIQGVADARYGAMTSGAILITTRAGRTPFNLSLNMNGGSTQATLSKGFQLKGKLGAVNISAGFTNSNKDPRDKIKSYNRINTSMRWTVDISDHLKNTFSFGYNRRLDNVKMDPDDDSQQRTYQKEHNFTLSNRSSWSKENGFIRRIDLNVGFSRGKQDSYTQWLLNGPPFGIADKDTTGVYEGFYVPGNYLAIEHILGIPISVNGNLDIRSKTFFTGSIEHRIDAGMTYSTSGNKGPGSIIDPYKPRWQGGNFKYRSERPFNRAETLPFLTNNGYYLQDHISGNIRGKKYTATLGFRADIQNGFLSYQPRIGVTYKLNKNWGMSLAYGISTKAPSLAHRYPAPSWTDIPVLQLYNGYADESLFLVYTKKIIPDNSYLMAARSASLEWGINLNNKWGNGSLFLYVKKNTRGFNSNNTPTPVHVPQYDYTIDDAHKIHYLPTGDTFLYTATRYTVTNGLYTADYGAELMFSTKEIESLATSFSIRSAFSFSSYDHRNDTSIIAVNSDRVHQGKPALYGVYEPDQNTSYSLLTTLSSITHIPRLGFTFTLSADFTLLNKTRRVTGKTHLLGYLDREMQYVPIPGKDVNEDEYDYLRQDVRQSTTGTNPRFAFPALNLTIAKEIKKKIRIMLTGYNMFNIRPKFIDPMTRSVKVYNQPVSLSAGIIFQL